MTKKNSKVGRQHLQTARKRPHFEISGANSEPIRSRLDRSKSVEDEKVEDVSVLIEEVDVALPDQSRSFLAEHFSRLLENSCSKDLPLPPPPPLPPSIWIPGLEESDTIFESSRSALDQQNAEAVTNGPGQETEAQEMMNANGTHPSYRHPSPHLQKQHRVHVNDVVSPINHPIHGPMPSHIQVAKPYVFYQAIEGCLQDLGVTQAREDNIRLAGVQWIDDVRKALKLYVARSAPADDVLASYYLLREIERTNTLSRRPVRTFDTAVIYYHKFRLSHADNEYSFVVSRYDAAIALTFMNVLSADSEIGRCCSGTFRSVQNRRHAEEIS